MRTCTNCGSKMAPYAPRKRIGDHMLCPACSKDPINGTNVSVQRPPDIDVRGVPLDSGLASRHLGAKAPKPKHILPHDGTLLASSDEWRYGVDGIEGHDLPPGWVDDGVSPYPWVRHDPRDQMHRSLDEIRNVVRHGPHGGPLPVGVYEDHLRRRALLGKPQVIPQHYVTPKRRVSKVAHKHEEHHGYGGQHWSDMDEHDRRGHMIKWHGWDPADYDKLVGAEGDNEHTYAHETGLTGEMTTDHHHGEASANHHHPDSAAGLWNHLKSHYHDYPLPTIGQYPGEDSEEGYNDLAALHEVGHKDANGPGTAHAHGADGIVSSDPKGFVSMHGKPPEGFTSWGGFLHHMQHTHGWGQGHDESSADFGALDQKHDEEHAEYDQSDENPVHSHSGEKTLYHTPLVDPLDKNNEEVKYHLQAYHGDVPHNVDPGALLVHHTIEHAKKHNQEVPHEHTSPEVDTQLSSLKTPYIPYPKQQKEHLQSHIALHHPEADQDAILDAQSQSGPQGEQALAGLHDTLHDDIDTDVEHTHAKPMSPAEQTVMTANANHAPHDYETDALTHLVEHHGLVPGANAPSGGYADTHKHLHEMWDGAIKTSGQGGNFGMVVPHDHGKKWEAEAALAKQPPTDDGSNLQADLLKSHLISPAHAYSHAWLDGNDQADWHYEHEKDHDSSSANGGDANAHGPHDHLGLPDVHPDAPVNMPGAPESPGDESMTPQEHAWLKSHMGTPGHNWTDSHINYQTTSELKALHDHDHNANMADQTHKHGHAWGHTIQPASLGYEDQSNGGYVTKPKGDDEPFTSLLDHLKGPLHGFGDHIDANDPAELQKMHNDDHDYSGYYTSPDANGLTGAGSETKAKPHPHDAHQGLPPVNPSGASKNLPGQVPSVGNGTKTYTPEPVVQGKQWKTGREGEAYLAPVDIVPHPTGKESAIEHLQKHHPEVNAGDYDNSPYSQDGYLKSWHEYLHGTANLDHPEWTPKDEHLHETQSGLVVAHTIPVGSHMVHDHAWSQAEVAGMTPKEFHAAHEQTHMHNDDKMLGHSHAYPGGPVIPPRTYWPNPEYAHLGHDHPEAHDWFHGTSSHYSGPPLAGQDRKLKTGQWPQHDSCVDTYAMGHLTSLYQQAKAFGSRVMRLRLNMDNPKIYQSINHMNHDQYERLMASGHLHDPDFPNGGRVHIGSSKGDYQTSSACCSGVLHDFFRGAYNKGHDSGAELVRASMRAEGYDGAMWRNHADSADGKQGPWNAYPLSHHQIEVVHENATPSAANSGDASRWKGAPSGWRGAQEPIEQRNDYPDREKIRLVHQAQDAGTLHTDFPVAPHPVDPKSHGTGFSSHPTGGAAPSGSSGGYHSGDSDDYDEDQYCSDCGVHGHDDSDDHCENCNEYGHDSSSHETYCPVCEETNEHGDNYQDHHEYCDYCGEHTFHESGDHEDEYGEHPTKHQFEDYCPHCGDVSKENREASECNACGGTLPDWSKIKTHGAVVPPWHKYLPSKRLLTTGQDAGHYEDIAPGEHTDEEMDTAKKQWQQQTGQMQTHGQGALFTPKEAGPYTVPPLKGAAHFDHAKDLADHLYHDHGSSPEAFQIAAHTDMHGNDTEEGYDNAAMDKHHDWLHLSGQANAHGFPATEHNHYTPGGPTTLGTGMDQAHLVAHMVMHHGADAKEAQRQIDEFGTDHYRQSHDIEHQVDAEKPWVANSGDYGNVKRLNHIHHEDATDIADLGGSPEDLDTHTALEHQYHNVPKEFADDPKMREAWHDNAHALGHPQDYLNHAHLADGTTRYTGKYTPTVGYSKNYQAQPADVPALMAGKAHLLHQHGTDLNKLHMTKTVGDLHDLHTSQHDDADKMLLPHAHVHQDGWADFGTDPPAHLHLAHAIPADGMEEPSLSQAHDEDHKSGLADHDHSMLPSTSDEKIHPLLMPSAVGNAAGNTSITKTLSEDAHLKAMHGINATGPTDYLHSLHKAVHANPATNEAAGGHEIDHDHYPEGAVIDSDDKVVHVKGVNDQGGANAEGWKDLIGHMKSAHPHLTGSGYLSHYLPSDEDAKKFHDLHEQAHAENGDANHTHEEDPALPMLGSGNTWANDKLAKHMNSEHGYAASVLQGFGTHDNMVHHHLTSHAQGYADSGPHSHGHDFAPNFNDLHHNPATPGQSVMAPVPGDKVSMHTHLSLSHAMSLPDATSSAEMQAMHDAEHDPAGLPDDAPTHTHVSLEGVNHHPPEANAELQNHIHQAHGYNIAAAQLASGESDPEKQHAHLHWGGVGLPDHKWHEHSDVANPFPPHNPYQYESSMSSLEDHLTDHHGWGQGDLLGQGHQSLQKNHDIQHSAEWMANNGLTQMPGHYHPPAGGMAKMHGPEMPEPDHNPVALSNHLSAHHNVPYPKTKDLTAGEQDAMHEDLHNTPFLTHHTHAAPPPSDPAAGQWQTNHLHDPQNFEELGHHMLTQHGWDETDLPTSPHGPALPDHPYHADKMLAEWHDMDHDDGTDSNFKPLTHQHPEAEQHPPLADWEHELMGNVPTPHPMPKGVNDIANHIGSWHGVEPNHSHYSEDLGVAGVGPHHHDLHLPGGNANHTHEGLYAGSGKPLGKFKTDPPGLDNGPDIHSHLQSHHGYTNEEANHVANVGSLFNEHQQSHEMKLPGSESHAHQNGAKCMNCGQHITHDSEGGWGHNGDYGCDEHPDYDDGEGVGPHEPDPGTLHFEGDIFHPHHSSLSFEAFFEEALA